MAYLSPTTLTADEQARILHATAHHPRDHAIISMALGTGLRLSELAGLNVGDVFASGRMPQTRIYVRREIANRGTAGDVFLPDRRVPQMSAVWRVTAKRIAGLLADDTLTCAQSRKRIWTREPSSCGVSGGYGRGSTGCTGSTPCGRTADTDSHLAIRDLSHRAAARLTDQLVYDGGARAAE